MSFDVRSTFEIPTEPGGKSGGNARVKILVVEDCEPVAKIVSLVLNKFGHEAITAFDGDNAVHVFVSEGPFDLLLTDVVLPGSFCGYQLAETLRERQPKLRVIFFTGHPKETISSEIGYSASVRHLLKPAMIAEIREAVQSALGL